MSLSTRVWSRLAILGCLVCAPWGVGAAEPAVSLGVHHSVALAREGTLFTWGDDSDGQLGLGRRIKSATPLALGEAKLAGATSLCAASGYSLAIAADGTAWGWGDAIAFGDGFGPHLSKPASVAALPRMRAISGRKYHALGLTTDGTVWAWAGSNPYPAQVPGLTGITAVSAGVYHSVALSDDGTVFTWSQYDSNGQIGNGTTPAPVPGLAGVTKISAGGFFTLALKSDGSVWAWGTNDSGQLGDGTFTDRASPAPVLGLPGRATQISAGINYALALIEGEVWAWGNAGSSFQLGDGSGENRATPGPVSNLTGVIAVSAGESFSLALRSDGTLWAWGHNDAGELGDGTFVPHSTPVQVAISGGVDLISAGEGQQGHALVRKRDGSLWTWGSNASGELGDGAILERSTPTRVPGLNGITAIAAGDVHTLALAADGTVWSWGENLDGQLGDGTPVGRSTPALVPGLSGVNAISAGHGHNLARRGDGTLVSWGHNSNGQLGRDFNSIGFTVLTGVRDFSAGGEHSVAVRDDGTVWAWGSNGSGELGDGTLIGRSVPTPVPGLANVIAVSAGSYYYTPYTLALKSDRTVWAWGDNSAGQLGDGTTTSRSRPAQVSGLNDVVEISAGGAYALARKSDGSVWAWGANESGQLGDGTTDNRPTPVQVRAITSAAAIGASRAAYFNHSTAAMSDGTLWAWGDYHSGQLGDGAVAQRVLPVVVVSEGGAGSIAGNDWFLDLDPARTKQIPPDKIPALLAIAAGNTRGAVVAVDASVKFRAQDIGNPIYVFGYVPAALVKNALRAKDGGDCVLAQLTSSGQAQQVSASSLQAYASNVISTQGQAVAVLNGVASASVAGSTFCVGTAAASGEAVSASNSTCLATVPSTPTGGRACLPPGLSSVSANAPGALSGLWWNPSESGWGIDFTQRRNVIFAAWYTYDASGNPKWYVASNCAMAAASVTSGTCNGTLYEVNGPTFFGTAFNPNAVNPVAAGTLSVNFTNASSASMTYTVGSQARTVSIARQVFASGATTGVDYTDLWWNPNESGWGMAITQQASLMFLAWYVYDSSGKPMWYVSSNCAVTGSGCTGKLYRTTGPALAPTFDSSKIQVFTVGSVTLTFSDADHGTLSYTVDGVSGTKSITRQVF